MSSRHVSRELAVQLVYQWDIDPTGLSEGKIIDRFWKEQARSGEDNRAFFEELVRGVAINLPAIDRRIEGALKNWKMNRVEKVDLAILRVAVFELFCRDPSQDMDAPIVINEAVEIAKKFGNVGSPGFINGVLDGLAKKENRTKN